MAQDKTKVEPTRRQDTEAVSPEDASVPLVDVYETQDMTVLVAEMPGVSRDSVRVDVNKGVLTISGQAQWDEPGEGYSRAFIGFGPTDFYRAFALSDEVDRDRITANMTDGVLVVQLPRAEAAKPRRIEIQAD